jgi:hypothetical protein
LSVRCYARSRDSRAPRLAGQRPRRVTSHGDGVTIERARSAVKTVSPGAAGLRLARLMLGCVLAILAPAAAPALGQTLTWSAPGAIDHQPTNASGAQINGVSCPTSSFCVAVDKNGNILTSTNPTGGSNAWQTEAVDTTPIESVSCSSTKQCDAVDSEGQVLTSTNPTGGATWSATTITQGAALTSVSCSAVDGFCAAVDAQGNAYTNSGTGWSTTPVDIDGNTHLNAISCASKALCVAVDQAGKAVVDTGGSWGAPTSLCVALDNAGNALVWTGPSSPWMSFNVDQTHYLGGASCTPTADFCVGVDAAGNIIVLESPGSGSLLTYEDLSNVDSGNDLTAVTCASDSLCVVGDRYGDVATSTSPESNQWSAQAVDFDNQMTSVSCASATLCAATDADGNILTSTDPLATWAVATQDLANNSGLSLDPTGVSCPSTSLCVAVDRNGNVLTSTDPAGGSNLWSTASQIDPGAQLLGVACSSQLCAAIDNFGRVLTAAIGPSTGLGTWSAERVDTTGHLTAISCGVDGQNQTLCAAADDNGDVLVSTDPPVPASWTTTQIDPNPSGPTGQYISGISCTPSVSLCAAVDHNGNVLMSTSPTQTTSWALQSIDQGHSLSSVSCSSVDLCEAADTSGNIVEYSLQQWGTPTAIDGVSALEAVSCAPGVLLCTAVDLYGNAVVGAPPETLSILITGEGSVSINGTTCTTDCQITVEQGAQLTLSAAPASGYTFAGWSGGGCSVSATCLITVAASGQVTASFLANPASPIVSSPQPPSSGTPSPPPSHQTGPTVAEVRAKLAHELVPRGRGSTLAAILKAGSYTFRTYTLPEAGTVTLSWYLEARGHRRVLVARGALTLKTAGTGRLRVKLTARGRRLLAGSRRPKLVAQVTFTPAGALPIATTHGFALTLRRRG